MFLIFRKEVDGTDYTDIREDPARRQPPGPAASGISSAAGVSRPRLAYLSFSNSSPGVHFGGSEAFAARAQALEHQPRVLDGPAEVPPLVELVARLVVVERVYASCTRRFDVGLVDEVRPRLEVGRGHADLREREVVGPVEEPLVGSLSGTTLRPRRAATSWHERRERALAVADQLDVAGPPQMLMPSMLKFAMIFLGGTVGWRA